jgi:hypothetical protein
MVTGECAVVMLVSLCAVLRDAVHLLTVSQDGQYVIAADHQGHIVVWTLADLKVSTAPP